MQRSTGRQSRRLRCRVSTALTGLRHSEGQKNNKVLSKEVKHDARNCSLHICQTLISILQLSHVTTLLFSAPLTRLRCQEENLALESDFNDHLLPSPGLLPNKTSKQISAQCLRIKMFRAALFRTMTAFCWRKMPFMHLAETSTLEVSDRTKAPARSL